jgi:hypothetical protein
MPNFMLLRTLIGEMKPLGAQDMAMEEGRQARIVFGAVFNVPCRNREAGSEVFCGRDDLENLNYKLFADEDFLIIFRPHPLLPLFAPSRFHAVARGISCKKFKGQSLIRLHQTQSHTRPDLNA